MVVALREITAETVSKIIRLEVDESQKKFVASNAVSLAQALFAPEAWYRAIYSGDEPVGFVMLHDESASSPVPDNPQICIWRLMIDKNHQTRGIGRRALALVVDTVRKRGIFSSLLVTYVPGAGSPEGFYARSGFAATGEVEEGEIVMRLAL